MGKSVKVVFAFAAVLTFAGDAVACPWCRVAVNNGIYDGDFLTNLFTLLLPVLLLAAAGIGYYHADKIANRFKGGIK